MVSVLLVAVEHNMGDLLAHGLEELVSKLLYICKVVRHLSHRDFARLTKTNDELHIVIKRVIVKERFTKA